MGVKVNWGRNMSSAKVVVVDDDPVMLNVVARILCQPGYDVMCVSNGREALDLVHRFVPIDLVISDWRMPGMEGPELLGAVRQVSPATAFVLMSASTAVPPPGFSFLRKPFRPNDLVDVVQKALAVSARARADLEVAWERATQIQQQSK